MILIDFVSSTPPYNADFDGDEMNMQYVDPFLTFLCVSYVLLLSVPQSEETRAELSQVAWVPRQVAISQYRGEQHANIS